MQEGWLVFRERTAVARGSAKDAALRRGPPAAGAPAHGREAPTHGREAPRSAEFVGIRWWYPWDSADFVTPIGTLGQIFKDGLPLLIFVNFFASFSALTDEAVIPFLRAKGHVPRPKVVRV